MRLDQAVVHRGLARSRTQAAQLVTEGQVEVDGVTVTKPSHRVGPENLIRAAASQWVSRAALKLVGALDDSGTRVHGRVLDAGASTGGFTQVCLERGAELVYAFDVGHDQLAAEVDRDPRVRRRDGLNLRDLVLADVDDDPVDLIVGDLSFISLKLLLGPLHAVLKPGGVALLLVKPQFEVGRHRLGPAGVVRDPADREAAVTSVVAHAAELGLTCDWRGDSVLPGSSGNIETFVRLS